MSKFNFDNPPSRRSTGSVKWDVSDRELPMWIADMDFETAPAVREAIISRAAHGIYGYTDTTDGWRAAYVSWWRDRHGLDIDPESLIFCTGIVPALSALVRKLTTPAEKVLVQTPVYNCFFNCIENSGRIALECPLEFDGESFGIDFVSLESALSDPQCTLMILCNPHNPVGRIWDRETLSRIGELCKKHSVTVISDEIHCDITAPGAMYVPFASVSDTCRDISITCISPTKTFNLAGLQTAAVFSHNKTLRHKAWRGINTDDVGEPNIFAVVGAVAAFGHGGEWLDGARAYIEDNKRLVYEFLANNLPQVRAIRSDATYLMWLDCTDVGRDSGEIADFIREDSGLFLSKGEMYRGIGNRFLRLNVACPRLTLIDGLSRLKQSVEKLTVMP